jgi:hypothetical protein
MTEPFSCTGRISKKEFACISMQAPTRQNGTMYLVMLLAAVMIYREVTKSHGGQSLRAGIWDWTVVYCCFMGLLVLLTPLRWYFGYLREYDRVYPELNEGYFFEFHPDRFFAGSGDFRSEIEWGEVKKLVRIGQTLVFRLGKGRTSYYLDMRELTPIQQEFILTSFRNSRAKR